MRIPIEALSLESLGLFSRLEHNSFKEKFPLCPSDLPLSCSNHTVINDSCCFEYPGGIMLQTQFWDYLPPRNMDSGRWNSDLEKHLGPNTSFTNHGLWPDNCDGRYEQFCDSSRQIDDVYHLLTSEEFNKEGMEIQGKELLEQMGKLWKSNTGDDESLWIHEFNKHATCIKTLQPSCYARWDGNEEAISEDHEKQAVFDYYRITMKLYGELDTFQTLEKHGIVPSVDKSYSRKQISEALNSDFKGKDVFFKCDRNKALNEIWYYHLLQGSLLGEQFEPIDSLRPRSNCPEEGIKFYPKGHRPHNGGRPGGGNRGQRGIIRVSGYNGFIIRNGHWMTTGTPANFDLIKAPFGNYYLKSRTGYCGSDNKHEGVLVCNKGISSASQFDYDETKGFLGLSGSFAWHANEYPRGRRQAQIYTGSPEDSKYPLKLKFVKLH